MTRPSIYEFAGGDEAFVELAKAHHQRCLDDPILNHPFSHPGDPNHLSGELLGRGIWRPALRYSQSHGGQSFMLNLHSSTGAESDMGKRFVACFVQAADDASLPNDSEFRESLHKYMEWAVQQVMEHLADWVSGARRFVGAPLVLGWLGD